MCHAQSCLTVTLWTVARQAPQSMGLPGQEYWSGLPFPSPRDIPDPGIKGTPLVSPALAGEFFFFLTTEPPGKLESTLEGNKTGGREMSIGRQTAGECDLD